MLNFCLFGIMVVCDWGMIGITVIVVFKVTGSIPAIAGKAGSSHLGILLGQLLELHRGASLVSVSL